MNKIFTASLLFVFCLASTTVVLAKSDTPPTLTKECHAITEPYATSLGIKMEDLMDTSKKVNPHTLKLMKYLKKIGKLEDVRSVCYPQAAGTTSCSDCSECHCTWYQCCSWLACYSCNSQCCGS